MLLFPVASPILSARIALLHRVTSIPQPKGEPAPEYLLVFDPWIDAKRTACSELGSLGAQEVHEAVKFLELVSLTPPLTPSP